MPTDGTLIPTTFNSRDAGGRPARSGFIRSGLLLRSDAPVRVDESGLDALRTLAIRTAIDLREPVERDLDPVELNGVKTPQIPILGPRFDELEHRIELVDPLPLDAAARAHRDLPWHLFDGG